MSHTECEIGYGALRSLGAIAGRIQAKRIWLVTGKRSFAVSGAKEIVDEAIGDRVVGQFSDFSENPTVDEIRNGVSQLRAIEADLVVAIGGGSALDTAKQVNLCASNAGDPRDYIVAGKEPSTRGAVFIACPTTAGTGSEMTHFAVCYEGLTKYSFAHNFLRPDFAIVDPALAQSLSQYQAASCAMDALSQLIESYWAVSATDDSRSIAIEGIRRATNCIEPSVIDKSESGMLEMARVANLSGRAIDISKTTAAHALSYPISILLHIPHGHSVVTTLAEWINFNYEINASNCMHPHGAEYVRRLIDDVAQAFGASDSIGMSNKLVEMMRRIGLLSGHRLESARDDVLVEEIADNVNATRMGNNPRVVMREDIVEILRKARCRGLLPI